MGEHEGWAAQQPLSGLLPNGLLPNEAASAVRVLDSERWMKAEERTAELIACIQPNTPSEGRRIAVADYVQRLISKCFPCQVFTFGSVPLKTYLPDGDIDLTAFSKDQSLKDTWAHQVRNMLENEEKNENAEFRVKEVQYVQAEVKIIKCLVESIVVDISFNQLGGLCTLCFLEEVDRLINQNHLFKRSIILIKAWCYYESRILGAHHGLISTYALETLVLYIFHVFNKPFSGPLEVMYRFLEFFSKFDWENFCVSLWGPVPISTLPDITAEPPRKDGGELLLSKYFLDTCSSRYAVCQENQGQPFVSKHFNVIDPLRINNNLGRSVSKGNFFRIRSAFAFGANKLTRILNCPKEDLYYEVNQFFMNTWERHGSGQRPDAPRNDLWRLRLSNLADTHGLNNVRSTSSSRGNDISSGHDTQAEGVQGSRGVSSHHVNYPSDSTSKISDVSTVSHTRSQKSYGSISNTKTSDKVRRNSNSNKNAHNDKGQSSDAKENLVTDVQGRYLFARTRSSPELTETYGGVSSQGRRNRVPEGGKTQIASMSSDNNGIKNIESDMKTSHNIKSSGDDPSSIRHTSTRPTIDAVGDPNGPINSYQNDFGLGTMGQDFSSVPGAQVMPQEEQDLVNLMASTAHGFNGQVPIPLNLAAGHLPFHIQSLLMGYNQRNLSGILPTNFQMFPQGSVSSPLAHYFPGIGLALNPEDQIEPSSENFGSPEINLGETENELLHEHDRGSSGGFDLDNGVFEVLHSNDKQLATSAGYSFVTQFRVGGSGSSEVQQKSSKETLGSTREDHVDVSQHHDTRSNDACFDERTANSRSLSASYTSSLRSKTSSESFWEGSSAKVSKPAREKQGKKTAASVILSTAGGKGKSVSEHSSQADDDGRDWNPPSVVGTEMAERTTGPQSIGSFPVPSHRMPGFEASQGSGSDSMIPIAPFLLGPGAGQRNMDNSGVPPLAFTITGPPVPFLFCPVYNIPTEAGTSVASTSHFSWDEALDNNDSGQNFESSEGPDQSDALNTSSSTRKVSSLDPLEHNDILNGDIASHWQNLQYGRFCQNPRYPPMIYPSPVVVPPVYLQGHFPLNGPGRPSSNVNPFPQYINYGPRVVPVTPLQSISNRPANVYQWYVDEMPRHRSGTGTYLPNPKAPMRERHSANVRRGKYNFDRNDHHSDRDGNWNANSKPRPAGRSHSRNQNEKSRFTFDQFAVVAGESRAERPWGSRRHDSFTSYQSRNGPIRSNSSQSNSASMPYGMYPLPAMNPGGVSSNGPTMPPVVMLYPYDYNSDYGSPAEQPEFESLGPVGFSGMNEVSQLSDGNSSVGVFNEQRFYGTSAQWSSQDQPSSPHFQR
ncbi:hypothetical protein F3Y22_tig00111096pilonHSYRG00006 [Hibiscus syriacus]|uniref:Polymerase nucleotidyl transferase domain-containing protein n=1 Tax=Hibiscus syriacus TaxID=106335 RepID=A0A6A2Z0S1_HIBSY|nr:hypothetical protein F3Y22_tig00111096pilonHSYRG00006 [Hibiscus syriacus]